MAFDKTWIVLVAGSGILALAVWGGVTALTMKMALLWTFIGFGFLTLVMHLFGSPISILLNKLLYSAENEQQHRAHSTEQLTERRNREFQRRQLLLDDKLKIYKENILGPREELLTARREAEFYRFSGSWKGKGHRLGHLSDEKAENFEDYIEEDYLDEEYFMNESTSSEEESKREDSRTQEEGLKCSESTSEHKLENTTQSLRQRTNRHSFELPEEPSPTEKGIITVALRCPDGAVKKRRFTTESQVQALVAFAEYLGYPPSRHVILTTYPRKPLSDLSQTFTDAGLTHDTALVIEES